MIRYKLLDTGKGIILTREPKQKHDEAEFDFGLLDGNAVAIFEFKDGRSSYKKLAGGACRLPLDIVEEESISICVAILDGSPEPVKWSCEAVKVKPIEGGNGYIVYPDDIDLQKLLLQLVLENEQIREDGKETNKRIDALQDKLKTIMEGYDLV